jgi:hypothetical protein
LEWTSDPKPISGFNQKFWDKHRAKNNVPAAVKNPVPAADEKATVINAPNCKIGNYTLDTKDIEFKGGSKDLGKKYLVGKADAPKVGDKRISYSAYPSDIEYTFAGALSGKKLTPYFGSDTDSLLPAAPGNFNAMLAALKSSDRIAGILWFLGGWILMAAGLMGMVGPITTLLEFIPFLGGLGSGLIKVVLALVALLLSAIFWWVIKLWWLVLIVIIAVAAFLIYKKKSAHPAAA